jgi:hypothetical protein
VKSRLPTSVRAVGACAVASFTVTPVKVLFVFVLYPLVSKKGDPPAAVYVAACASKSNVAVKVNVVGTTQPVAGVALLSILVLVGQTSAQSI